MNRISMTESAKAFFKVGRNMTNAQRHLIGIICREHDEIIPCMFRLRSSEDETGVLYCIGGMSMPVAFDNMVILEDKGLIKFHMTWTNEGSGWGQVFPTEKGMVMGRRYLRA
jgi:hypothetical protein